MKSEKPKIIELFKKLPKVVSRCETVEQLIVAQRYTHLAYRMYPSRILRVLGTEIWSNRWKTLLCK